MLIYLSVQSAINLVFFIYSCLNPMYISQLVPNTMENGVSFIGLPLNP